MIWPPWGSSFPPQAKLGEFLPALDELWTLQFAAGPTWLSALTSGTCLASVGIFLLGRVLLSLTYNAWLSLSHRVT